MRALLNLIFLVLALTLQLACGQTQVNSNASKPTSANASRPSAQAKDYPKLKLQANELVEASNRKDFNTVVSLTYPKLVEMVGGREKILDSINQGMKEAEAQNVKILSFTLGEPGEVISVERQLLAIIPSTMKLKVPEGTLTGQSFLIGVSEDGGENWTFVDASGGMDREKLKALFPAAADKLKIPETKPPVLER